MGNFKNSEEARAYFSCDRFAAENGLTLDELAENHAVTSLTVGDRHKNAYGGVMGGVLFTLADFAFAAAVNSHGRVTVSVNSSIAIHKSVSEGWLYATATETLDHRKLPYCVVEIKDEAGNLIATFTGLAYRFPENDPRNQALPTL